LARLNARNGLLLSHRIFGNRVTAERGARDTEYDHCPPQRYSYFGISAY
jgi:hypothetical protein